MYSPTQHGAGEGVSQQAAAPCHQGVIWESEQRIGKEVPVEPQERNTAVFGPWYGADVRGMPHGDPTTGCVPMEKLPRGCV